MSFNDGNLCVYVFFNLLKGYNKEVMQSIKTYHYSPDDGKCVPGNRIARHEKVSVNDEFIWERSP